MQAGGVTADADLLRAAAGVTQELARGVGAPGANRAVFGPPPASLVDQQDAH
jgi:hypothetical protein